MGRCSLVPISTKLWRPAANSFPNVGKLLKHVLFYDLEEALMVACILLNNTVKKWTKIMEPILFHFQ